MDEDQRRARMRAMRHVVREANVYRWAATLLSDLSDIRLDMTDDDAGFERYLSDPAAVKTASLRPSIRRYDGVRQSA
jgi:trehalose-6-phosphate synthase